MPLSFLTSRSKDAESATPALMQLKDAHFAYYSESNKFEILNMAKIKEFTGQETLAGRKLHSDYINFKPKCHHLVASNNDFEIMGTDHGTWRRVDYFNMKIKFCAGTDKYDEKNPYERLADPNMGSSWTEDDEVLASYLGILAYYYESLQNNYDGKVRNVPHPHIRQETEEFRNRQDRVNNFLNLKLVKSADEDSEMPIAIVKMRYVNWYESNYPGTNKEYQRVAIDQLENSKIQSFIKKSKRGNFLKGYRVLDLTEEKDDDEEYYTDLFERENNNTTSIKSETTIEYIDRLCKEYDMKKIENTYEFVNPKSDFNDNINYTDNKDDDSSSDIEDMVADNIKREPNKFAKKQNNSKLDEIKVDSNGIKIIPKKKIINRNDMRSFAMMGRENSDDESSTEEDSDE